MSREEQLNGEIESGRSSTASSSVEPVGTYVGGERREGKKPRISSQPRGSSDFPFILLTLAAVGLIGFFVGDTWGGDLLGRASFRPIAESPAPAPPSVPPVVPPSVTVGANATTIAGAGSNADTKLDLAVGQHTVTLVHNGTGNFIVHLVDSQGNVTYLANQAGNFAGTAMMTVPWSAIASDKIALVGEYTLDVTADGSWTVVTEWTKP